jgi:hypothetical protein
MQYIINKIVGKINYDSGWCDMFSADLPVSSRFVLAINEHQYL